MPRDVFISYHSADLASAERIRALLERNGISCWISTHDLPPGNAWPVEIQDGIRRSHVMLLILSSNTKHSRHIAREVALADENRLRIVPFYIENVAPPPEVAYYLADLQRIDGSGPQFESGVRKLIEFIRQSPKFPARITEVRLDPGKERIPGLQAQAPAEVRPDSSFSNQAAISPNATRRNRQVYFLVAGVLLATVLASSIYYYWLVPARKKQEIDTAFKDGIEAFGRNDDLDAIGRFSRLLDLQPGNVNALEHRAQAYHHQGRDDLALLDVDKAMNLQGADSTGLHLLRGEVLKGLRRYSEALSEFNSFLAAHPTNQQALDSAQHARDETAGEMELQSFTGTWLTQFDNGSSPKRPARTKELGLVKQRTFDRCEQDVQGKTTCYYDSTFEKARSVIERIVLLKGENGNWQVDGYGYGLRQTHN
jgi:tetratricopeptide (TPR) repeat protein